MDNLGSYYVQSSLNCGGNCTAMGKAVMALHMEYCYCGNLLPNPSTQLDASACNSPCDGWTQEDCGGDNAYTVWLTGTSSAPVGYVGSSDSSSSSPVPTKSTSNPIPHPQSTPSSHQHSHNSMSNSQHTTQSVVTTTQKVVKTAETGGASPSPDSQNVSASSGSSNGTVIGIAVGVVAGVLAFAGFVAIILFYLRRRRRMKNAENGHRRADSLNAFVASGAHTPGSAVPSFGSLAGKVPPANVDDTRLDPRIMQETRRISGASFLADNEDYSRRILKVTNPDGT